MKIKPITVALIIGLSLIVVALWVAVLVYAARKQRPTPPSIVKAEPTPQTAIPTAIAPPEETEAESYERASQEAARMFADWKTNSPTVELYIASMIPAQYNNGDTLDITVNQSWHVQHYQLRLQFAQLLDKQWRTYRKNANVTRIRILDLNGNEVGATGVLGVWVQE